jgi:hypothetical protein
MALVLLPTGSSSAQLTNDWELRAGVLTLEIHASRTAHLFHVVDQISQWSEFCHHQYIDWLQRPEDGLS